MAIWKSASRPANQRAAGSASARRIVRGCQRHRPLSVRGSGNRCRPRRSAVLRRASRARVRGYFGRLLGVGSVLRAAKVRRHPMMDSTATLPAPIDGDAIAVSTLTRLAADPRRRNLARKAEERAHPPRLPARRAALHAHARHHQRRRAAPGRPQGGDRLGALSCARVEHAASSTIRRRLAALSSLYKHLVRHGHAARNPVGEVERPAINRDEGATLAFSKAQARKLLDLPAEDTIAGLARSRDPVGRLAGRVAPRRDRRAQGRRSAPEPRL